MLCLFKSYAFGLRKLCFRRAKTIRKNVKGIMNAKQFFDAVVRMRNAQNEYFRLRTSASLKKAKSLENIVDREIERVEGVVNESMNPKLFPDT